jgi:hypothetical protein
VLWVEHKVINFLHYQKRVDFGLTNGTTHSKKVASYAGTNVSSLSTGSLWKFTIKRAFMSERVNIEKYITNEDQYLKLIKEELAAKYGDEVDKRLRADFDETEKALTCRRLYILSYWTGDQKVVSRAVALYESAQVVELFDTQCCLLRHFHVNSHLRYKTPGAPATLHVIASLLNVGFE